MIIEVNGLGTIEGSEDFLCEICLAFQYASECNSRKGVNGLSNRYKTISDSIFEQLDAVGCYDDAKKRLSLE